MIYKDLSQLHNEVSKTLDYRNGNIKVINEKLLKEKVIDNLIYSTVFSENQMVSAKCKYIIINTARSLGIIPSSTNNLYKNGFAKEKIKEITVPAINIRTLTFEIAQLIFNLMLEKNIIGVIFEIAGSEIDYTKQSPSEYASCILAAAIKTGYKGQVFLQGDHYQFNKNKFYENKKQETQRLKELIKQSVNAFFYNIDIDASTLVDLEKKDLIKQQEENYKQTLELTEYIRKIQPKNINISIGGEIGHIGGKNSTVDDFNAFMKGYAQGLSNRKIEGISKISIQTGSNHGGIIGPDGKILDVDIDFNVLSLIGNLAKKDYGLGGVVQHGASTLPEDLFSHFPKYNTLEIHLATEFQNIIFEYLPDQLKQKVNEWILKNCKNEWKTDWNETQFIYKLRKRALGLFKKELWDLKDSDKNKIFIELRNKIEFLFKHLNLFDTKSKFLEYID